MNKPKTNYKEILRLYCSRDYSLRQIAKALKISRNTVDKCLDRVAELQLRLPIPESMTNEELTQILFPPKEDKNNPEYCAPDYAKIVIELKKPHVTRNLLWKEYSIEAVGTGLKIYSISRFNELVNDYIENNKIFITRYRVPGEVLELDWSGSSITLYGKADGIEIKCHLFVASFPYSCYFYAEAFADETTRSWTQGIVNALRIFGGVPKILRPDNCKTATIKADRYEPDLNTVMMELSEHYGTVTIPARVQKPTDKNVVESSVGYASRQIIAALRNQRFYSLEEMNREIFRLTDELNDAPFTKKEYSRTILFEKEEQPALLPLPPRPFELFERATARIAPDYHVAFDTCYYSVPWNCHGTVKVRANSNTVIIETPDGKSEIARHKRGLYKGQKITDTNHLAPAHQDILGWSGEKFREEASAIGGNTRILIERVLASAQYEVQTYRRCRGILNLKKKYDKATFEATAELANEIRITSYKEFKALLNDDSLSLFKSQKTEDEDDDCSHLYLTHSDSEKEDK